VSEQSVLTRHLLMHLLGQLVSGILVKYRKQEPLQSIYIYTVNDAELNEMLWSLMKISELILSY
jgi:hypothetical protein